MPDLDLARDKAFLEDVSRFPVQAKAYKTFYQGLQDDTASKLGFEKVDFFVFKTTGGSNLDPDDDAVDLLGNSYSLERDICQKYDLILAITDYSLTAPLTAFIKNTALGVQLFMELTK